MSGPKAYYGSSSGSDGEESSHYEGDMSDDDDDDAYEDHDGGDVSTNTGERCASRMSTEGKQESSESDDDGDDDDDDNMDDGVDDDRANPGKARAARVPVAAESSHSDDDSDDDAVATVKGVLVKPIGVNVKDVSSSDTSNKRKLDGGSALTDKDAKDMFAWDQLEQIYVPEWWDQVRRTGKDHLKVSGISPEHMAYIIGRMQKAGPLRNANTAPEDEQERMGLMFANPEARQQQLKERRRRGQGVDNYAVIADPDGDEPILVQTKYGEELDHPNLTEFTNAVETAHVYLDMQREEKGKPPLAKPPLQLLFVNAEMKLGNKASYYENIAPKKNLFLIRLPGFKPDLRHLEEKEQLKAQKKQAKKDAQDEIDARLLDLGSLLKDPNYNPELVRRIGLPVGKALYPCQEKVRLHLRVQHAQTKDDHVSSTFDFFRVDKLSEYELANPGKPMPWSRYRSKQEIADHDELEETWKSDFEALKGTDPAKYAEYEAMTHPSTRLMGIFGAPGLGKSVCATMAAATVLPRGMGRGTKKERAITVFFIFSTYLNPLNQIGDDLKPLLQARYGEYWKDRICFIGSKNESQGAQHCPTVPDLMARLGETEVVEKVKDEKGKWEDVTRTRKPAVVFPVTRRSAELAYKFINEITAQNKKAKKGDNKFVQIVLALDEADVYDVGPYQVVKSDGKTVEEVWPKNDYAAQAMRKIVHDNARSFAFYMTGTPSQHLRKQIDVHDGRIVLEENVSDGIARKHLADYQVTILHASAKNLNDAKAKFEPRTVQALESHTADAGVFLKANELIPELKQRGEFRILMQGRTTAELEDWRRVLEGPNGVCDVHGCDVKFFFVLDPSVKFSADDGKLKLELKKEASNRKYKQFKPFQDWPTCINETFTLDSGMQGKRSRPRFLILAGLDIIARAINLPKAQATVFTSLEHDLKNITDEYIREFIQKIRILRVDPDMPDQVKSLYLMGADDPEVCQVHLHFLQRYDPDMRERRPPQRTSGSTGSTSGGKRKSRDERDQEVVDANLIWDAKFENYPSNHPWPSRAQLEYNKERDAKAKKNDKKHEEDLKKAARERLNKAQAEQEEKLKGIPLHVSNSANPDRQLCYCFRLMLIGGKRPPKKNETGPVDAKCSSWTAFLKEKRGKAAPATVKTLPLDWRFVLAEPYFQRLEITAAEAWILVAFLMEAPASTRSPVSRVENAKCNPWRAQCMPCTQPKRAGGEHRTCCNWGTCLAYDGGRADTNGYCSKHFSAVTAIAQAALAEAQPGVAYDAAAHFALGDARVQADPATKCVPGKKYVPVTDRPTSAGAGSSTDPLPPPST